MALASRCLALLLFAVALTLTLVSVVDPLSAQTPLEGNWEGRLECGAAPMKMRMRVVNHFGNRFQARLVASTGPGVTQAIFLAWTVDAVFDPANRNIEFTRREWLKKGDLDVSMFHMSGTLEAAAQSMHGRVRLRDCGDFRLTRSTKEQAPQPKTKSVPRTSGTDRILAEFRDFAEWKYTGGEVAGRVTLLANGNALLQVESVSSSGAFKFFAEPHAALVVTDARGNVIAQTWVAGLVTRMSASGLDHKRDRSNWPVKAAAFRPAAYAFFAFKYCAFQQTFERSIGANNGCYQSDLRREYDAFVGGLPQALNSVSAKPGETFAILGWRGVAIR